MTLATNTQSSLKCVSPRPTQLQYQLIAQREKRIRTVVGKIDKQHEKFPLVTKVVRLLSC